MAYVFVIMIVFAFRYRRFMDETWLTLSVLSDEATTVTVSDLLPGTEYQFMILARCQSGEEQFSAETTATTKGHRVLSLGPIYSLKVKPLLVQSMVYALSSVDLKVLGFCPYMPKHNNIYTYILAGGRYLGFH